MPEQVYARLYIVTGDSGIEAGVGGGVAVHLHAKRHTALPHAGRLHGRAPPAQLGAGAIHRGLPHDEVRLIIHIDDTHVYPQPTPLSLAQHK